ncbi:MAG TPA: hypothetical protein VGK53_12525 [Propionicimonas sp.]|jgi:hypothetical protein
MASRPTDAGLWTRRTLVGSLFAVGAAGLLGCTAAKSPSDQPSVDEEDPLATDPADESTPGFEIAVGDYSATVADGWKSVDDGKGGVVVTNGANRLTVVIVTMPKDALAVDEIAGLARSHAEGFSGTFAEPVDRSSAVVKRASVAGTGKFQDQPARLLSELWIDSTGFALLTTRTITAKADSEISDQAQEMVDELTIDF